uniref:Uncharacterized protein n=1 Tax=Cacopsylla melanoneura TaxID=428564 RepID=A0A8D8TUE9_9HEMI
MFISHTPIHYKPLSSSLPSPCIISPLLPLYYLPSPSSSPRAIFSTTLIFFPFYINIIRNIKYILSKLERGVFCLLHFGSGDQWFVKSAESPPFFFGKQVFGGF